MTALLCLGLLHFGLQISGAWPCMHYLVSNSTQIHDLATPPQISPPQRQLSPELWNPASRTSGIPPPSYGDSIADLPPDYTSTDALVYAQTPEYTPFPSLNASICSNVPNCLRLSRDTSPISSIFFEEKSLYADIDFGFNDEGVRSHAKKKGKQNAAAPKKPAASNAIDDGDKKKDEEAAGAGDGAGGTPPADGGAGGGDGGDGSGGDKGDDSGKEGKKKTKKEIKEEERLKKEEEEKAAKEEEERLAKEAEEEAERKKKEEDDAAAAAAAASASNDLSWAEPATNNDDWGGAIAGAGKKKKGKKGKVRNFGCMMTL
jgi:hypothetical protein